MNVYITGKSELPCNGHDSTSFLLVQLGDDCVSRVRHNGTEHARCKHTINSRNYYKNNYNNYNNNNYNKLLLLSGLSH